MYAYNIKELFQFFELALPKLYLHKNETNLEVYSFK